MSDNSYDTTSGRRRRALNLVSGQTHGVVTEFTPGGGARPGSDVVDKHRQRAGHRDRRPAPFGDDCSSRDQGQLTDPATRTSATCSTPRVSPGAGSRAASPTATKPDGTAVCGATHNVGAILGGTGKSGSLPLGTKADYIPHHEPFQYYASTANPHHLPPSSVDDDRPHRPGQPPVRPVGLLGRRRRRATCRRSASSRRRATRTGTPGTPTRSTSSTSSSSTINQLQKLPDWKDTAIVIAYDDSDGWYDHQASPIVSTSASPADALDRPGQVRRLRPHAGRLPGPLRPRPAAAAAGHLAVREAKLRRPHADRPDLDPAVHRGQLGHRPHRRRFVRRAEPACWTTCSPSPGPPNRRWCSTR